MSFSKNRLNCGIAGASSSSVSISTFLSLVTPELLTFFLITSLGNLISRSSITFWKYSMSDSLNTPQILANSNISYSKQPAQKAANNSSTSPSVNEANSLETKRFKIVGWSTTISQLNVPDLSVLLYVYIGSGLPKNWCAVQLVVVSSVNLMLYGGNHIILPPLAPFSQAGKSVNNLDSLQARFSIENIYFLALFSPKASTTASPRPSPNLP